MGIYLGENNLVDSGGGGGGGGGGEGGYICTVAVNGSGMVVRPYGADLAIISGHGSGCCYGTLQLLPSDSGRMQVGNVTATNCNGSICYTGAYSGKVSFFGDSSYSGKTGYIDVLVVGGGGGGAMCSIGGATAGAGGGVIECLHYPISNLGYNILVGEGGKGRTSACCTTPTLGGTSSFGALSASGGCRASGYPYGCSGGGVCFADGGSGGGSRGEGIDGVIVGECTDWHICGTSFIRVYQAGNGGKGYCSSISGETHAYGGGGGGGGGGRSINSYTTGCQAFALPGYGVDGGGDGGVSTMRCSTKAECVPAPFPGCDATYYGGGGGGAGCGKGGDGCQGVVIIRYHTDGSDKICAACTIGGTKYQCGAYTIHCFTNIGQVEQFIPVYK